VHRAHAVTENQNHSNPKSEATGRPQQGDGHSAEQLLVTASTAELQQFVRQHADTKGAFTEPVELTRIDRQAK
jgi:hypothetical protein